jgi:hypothetical protein
MVAIEALAFVLAAASSSQGEAECGNARCRNKVTV